LERDGDEPSLFILPSLPVESKQALAEASQISNQRVYNDLDVFNFVTVAPKIIFGLLLK
jgi:hypothetical protein